MTCKCSRERDEAAAQLSKTVLGVFLAGARERLEGERLAEEGAHVPKQFSVFVEEDMVAVHATAARLASLPTREMLVQLTAARRLHGPTPYTEYLARAALWKHPDTAQLTLPPVHQTLPGLFFEEELLGPLSATNTATCTVRDPEQKLAWWREDPGLAEHHFNWHVYYPYTQPPRDRQGELFAYMHLQMLARYDFERLAAGFSRVRAYGPGYTWDKALKEGYNPRLAGMSFRPASMQISNLGVKMGSRIILTDVMQRNKERLFYAVARGYLECPDSAKVEITMDNLGNTVEANMGSVNRKLYGNIHNDGHNVIATMNDPDGRYQVETGPMISNATAPRDPVFYRWHKFVDAIFEAHRVNLTPYSAADFKLRQLSVDSITVISDPVEGHADTDNHLYTFMECKAYTVYGPARQALQKSGLNHVPFRYKIKVRNTAEESRLLVFRVFVAPENEGPLEEWRNTFVEMDKFVEQVEPLTTLEISRWDSESSVILPPQLSVQEIEQGGGSGQARCGCGWPPNLLLPRGSPSGMKANLYVLVSDWLQDGVSPHEALPGSVSYCGKTGARYPDKRPMGFPFDRQTTFKDLDRLVRDVPNSASRMVKITFLEEMSENVVPNKKETCCHGDVTCCHSDEQTTSDAFILVN